MTDVTKMLVTSSPWPTAVQIKAAQGGMRDELKDRLVFDQETGMYMTQPADGQPLWEQLVALNNLEGRRAVELYDGGGGSSRGHEMVGGTVSTAFEWNPEARAVYAANHPQTRLVDVDLMDVAAATPRLIEACREGVDLLWSSNPCVWSKAGPQDPNDPRRSSYVALVSLLKNLHAEGCCPDVICGEIIDVQAASEATADQGAMNRTANGE